MNSVTRYNANNFVLDQIHNTPIIRLAYLSFSTERDIYLKLEQNNPGGSMKDRVALYCIEEAERQGELEPKTPIVESTSGSLGVALAMVGQQKGYPVICVVDPKVTKANWTLMQRFGAEIVVADQSDENGIYLESRLANVKKMESSRNAWWLNQYTNENCPAAHYQHTAPEIHYALDGNVDWVIVPVGTGGLVAGISRYFKERIPTTRIMAVDAMGSVALGGPPGPRRQVGLGSAQASNFIDFDLLDELVYVSDEDCFACAHKTSLEESILVGGSTASALAALQQNIAKTRKGDRIVVLSPDSGLKYVDTIYNNSWLF